ncbi:Wzz/FepE/Etk N-terminal domain-containing protein [Mitsuaria sp. WAJ17]|uniref:Wzz/FepE/Etk N-terminal domain-containing protein n=1 Tax=Mitsuaria sp. WAJ17 TaxID=2761452 RepID=UPI0028735DAD|nr:Wzz/FepE/Etk N-terminal domain-containing protein [Mitsuaria sp. WAJ17]
MSSSPIPVTSAPQAETWSSILSPVRAQWLRLSAGSVLIGCIGLGISFIVPPTFTARTQVLPPVQQQSGAMAAMASLGALSGLLGGMGGGGKNTAEQYVGLLQSETVVDRMVERFKLVQLYESKYRVDARKELAGNTRVSIGKKDGLIAIEVDDESPQRAADMANAYVEELQRLSSSLDITEAQQRRSFFERQLKQARADLDKAQEGLAASGFTESTLRAEPKAAADSFARLKATLTAAEVKLRGLEATMTSAAPEVQQQQSIVASLRSQVQQFADDEGSKSKSSYVSAYRNYRYNELLVELFAKQFELARMDEAREGGTLQVVDKALVPERKSKPKRSVVGLLTTLGAFVVLSCLLILREQRRRPAARP